MAGLARGHGTVRMSWVPGGCKLCQALPTAQDSKKAASCKPGNLQVVLQSAHVVGLCEVAQGSANTTLASGKAGVQTCWSDLSLGLPQWGLNAGLTQSYLRACQHNSQRPRVPDPYSKSTSEFRITLGPGCVSMGRLRW